MAIGDGNPDNDLFPSVSQYLVDLSASTHFPEILVTDSRGYVIAASVATDDFDQGSDDWTVLLTDGTPVFEQLNPVDGGEDWYRAGNSAKDGFYISDIIWNESTGSWGIDMVSQLRDPKRL